MKSYNHFLHCLVAESVFGAGFTPLTRQQGCERMLNLKKNIATVHLKDTLHSLRLHTHVWASVVTLQLTAVYRPATLHRRLIREDKPTLRSLTAVLKIICTCLQRANNWVLIMQCHGDIRPLGLTGRSPLSSFCGGTSFCFLETEFKHLFSCVNCADVPSGPCLGRLLQNSPRPLRNLLTPLCSVSGSSSRYCSTLCSNRPVNRWANIMLTVTTMLIMSVWPWGEACWW